MNELQILHLAHNKSEIERRVHAVIDKFAERGLRSLAVAYQVRRQCSLYLGLLSTLHILDVACRFYQFYAYVVLVVSCSILT